MLTVKRSTQKEGEEKKESIYLPKPKHIQQAGGSPLKQPNATIQGIRHTQRFFLTRKINEPPG